MFLYMFGFDIKCQKWRSNYWTRFKEMLFEDESISFELKWEFQNFLYQPKIRSKQLQNDVPQPCDTFVKHVMKTKNTKVKRTQKIKQDYLTSVFI